MPDRVRTAALLVMAGLSGCWLDGQEWAEKRLEAAIAAEEAVEDAAARVDLGLGACVDGLLEDGLIHEGLIEAVGDGSQAPSTCPPSAGAERQLAWSVPRAGCWVVEVEADDFTPTTYVADGCGGQVSACAAGAVLVASLPAGPTLVVVDTPRASDAGAFELATRPLVDVELGTDTSAQGSNHDVPTLAQVDCDGPAGNTSGAGVYLSWSPPRGGTWRFEVEADFDVVLSVHEGCALDVPVHCVDDGVAGSEAIELLVQAGQPVLLRVGGAWAPGAAGPDRGEWSLTIDEL